METASSQARETDGQFQTLSARVTPMTATPILYTSALLALLQASHFGWSLSQLNYSLFNNKAACDARPVADGTCVMFPGHSAAQWTWVVNAWVVGGMLGSLTTSRVSDRFGRKTTFLVNSVTMAIGAVVQATASSIAVFAIGRGVAGVASGVSTAVAYGYISEISPPHLRGPLGVGCQIAIGVGILVVSVSFFFADNSLGWRVIAGFPAVMALVFALAAPQFMVESPAWLIGKGRHEDAEKAIARLFGDADVAVARTWITLAPTSPLQIVRGDSGSFYTPLVTKPPAQAPVNSDAVSVNIGSAADKPNPWRLMYSPPYLQQTLLAMCLALSLQFSGINAVFFYSSSMFTDAGVADDRVGSLIVNVVNILPSFGASWLATRFGNRTMILAGLAFMLLCTVGLTVALLVDVSALSIAFTALYVAGFGVSLGPLAFVVAAEVFPDDLRATGGSLATFLSWSGTLLIGVGYPYVAEALGNLGFLPFMATLLFATAFLIKYLPETSGKTSEEIQAMYRTANTNKAL